MTVNRKDAAKRAEWNGMSNDEKVQWFRRQKRDKSEKFTRRTLEHTEREEDICDVGRKAWDDMIPYDVFWSRKHAQGWSQQQIDDDWRECLMDPDIGKEEVCIKGKKHILIAQFGGVQRYTDTRKRKASSLSSSAKLENKDDMDALAKKKSDWMANLELDGHLNRGHGVIMHHRSVPAEENRDIHVPVHKRTAMLPSPFDASAPNRVMKDLESDIKQREEQVKRDAIDDALAPVEKSAKKRKRPNPGLTRVRISTKSTLEDIVARLEEELREHKEVTEATLLSVAGLEKAGSSWKLDIEKSSASCLAAGAKALADVKALVGKLDTAATEDDLKALVADARDQEQTYKKDTCKDFLAVIKTVRRKINAEEAKTTKRLAAASTVKYHNPRADKVADLIAAWSKRGVRLGTQAELECGKLGHKYDVKEIRDVACKVANMSYIANLERFLTKYMSERTLSTQTCSLNTTKIHSLRIALHDKLTADYILSVPEDGRLRRPSNGAYDIQLMKMEKHNFLGVTNFGIGECYLLLKGTLKVCGGQLQDIPGGTLNDKLEACERGGSEEFAHSPWFWHATLDTPGTIVAVPEANMLALSTESALVLRWGFGCVDMAQAQKVYWSVDHMLSEFPAMATDAYDSWLAWLSSWLST